MNELSSHNTGAGKGDKDRSPGWRDHYEEINWRPRLADCGSNGFERVSAGRLRKRYGTRTETGVAMENWDSGKIDSYAAACIEAGVGHPTEPDNREWPNTTGLFDRAIPGTDHSAPVAEDVLSPLPPHGHRVPRGCCGGHCEKHD